ncbi:MAG: type I-C CRISPR-associated protein Cas8c/Csd1 [Ignavibacteria bacterium]|nr:type I-C CRISPR-associated protein Cas8c/Csd1 [Ignavibacteria bacterium]
MIQELVALAQKVRRDKKDQSLVDDALCEERLDAFICIAPDGRFLEIIPTEKKGAVAEDLVRTENKGRTSNVLARLILDNAKYVLGLPRGKRSNKCLDAYLTKLKEYDNVPGIKEVISFYEKNKEKGLNAARKAFESKVQSKQLKAGTNFSFLIRQKGGKDTVVHSSPELIKEIKKRYEESEKKLKGDSSESCSVCGRSDYRVRNLSTHGTISGILPRNPLGNYLVSYEGKAFSSYGLEGNDNSLICTHCAKAYVDAMNWLLAPRSWAPTGKKGKMKPDYKNRKDISDDTQFVFWLQEKLDPSDLALLDQPNEEAIKKLFDSVYSGEASRAQKLKSEKFYSITLSGAAARIAVRDWIETSLENLRANLAQWFTDIEIMRYDSDQEKLVKHYPRFWELVRSVKSKSTNEVQYGRIGAVLWKCAVMGYSPPLWMIHAVLNRIRAEQSAKPEEGKKRSPWEVKLPERIALLQLYLKRKNNFQERSQSMPDQNGSDQNVAYVCGQIFAVLESIQYFAMGSNINAPIRQRFFSSASTTPSTAFARLCKLAQHHLSKIRGENYGLFVNLDKSLQELMAKVGGTRFPAVFTLEDQASFAIGYYHQRQKEFSK